MDLIIIGGGSNAGAVIDIVNDNRDKPDHIYISDDYNLGKKVNGIEITLKDKELSELKSDSIFIVSFAKNMKVRERLYKMIPNTDYITTIVSRSGYISETSVINKGCIVMPNVAVRNNTSIGCNVLLNTACIIEHNCKIGDHSHVAPAAVLLGNVEIGNNTVIGGNATVLPNLRIGANCIIGAGAVVTKNVPDNEVWAGNPAKRIKINV